MSEQENTTETIKLHSSLSIAIGSFIGGPLAAGFLIGENYRMLDEPKKASTSMIVSIMATIILIVLAILIPYDNNSIGIIMSFIYAIIAHNITESKQGEILTKHKYFGNLFFSVWNAIGVGIVAMIMLIAFLFLLALVFSS